MRVRSADRCVGGRSPRVHGVILAAGIFIANTGLTGLAKAQESGEETGGAPLSRAWGVETSQAIDAWVARQPRQAWLERPQVTNVPGIDVPLWFLVPEILVPFFATADPAGLQRADLQASTPVGVGLQARLGWTVSELTISALGRYHRLWFSGVKVRASDGATQGGMLEGFGGGIQARYTFFNLTLIQPYVGVEGMLTAWNASFLVNSKGAPETVEGLATVSGAVVLGIDLAAWENTFLEVGVRCEYLLPDEVFGRGSVFGAGQVLVSPYLGLFHPYLVGAE